MSKFFIFKINWLMKFICLPILTFSNSKTFSFERYEDCGRVNGWLIAARKIDTTTIWVPSEIMFWLQILICLLFILPYCCSFIFSGLIIKVKKRNCLAIDIKSSWKSCTSACGSFVCLFVFLLPIKRMRDKQFAWVKNETETLVNWTIKLYYLAKTLV